MPGLEVTPSTSLQVATQSDEDKYYNGSEIWNSPNFDQSGHSDFHRPIQSNDQSQVKSQKPVQTIAVLIAVLSLAVALGIGLGVGLSAQHKQNSFE